MLKKKDKGQKFIKMPVFSGGAKGLDAFITKHLKYPELALENKIEGAVHLKYIVDYKGFTQDIHVLNGLGHGCDEEAKRLVSLLQYIVPKNKGLRVLFNYKLKINFNLPSHTQSPLNIVYHYKKKSQ